MRRGFFHTPWDGSHPLFRIGLHRLDLANWIEVDGRLLHYLDEKQRLGQLYPGALFMAEAQTLAAQQEVFDLLIQHLVQTYPDLYEVADSGIRIADRLVAIDDGRQPLETAASMVAEDLLLLRKDKTAWRLVAGSLCFPSSWSLAEKFSKPLDEIHQPVPGFGPGSRNATLMARIFDQLNIEEPVWRMNWSIYGDDELFHDNRLVGHEKKRHSLGLNSFVRVEYQTLRKLPVSGDILFTVGIHVDPVKLLVNHPEKARLVQGLCDSLNQLDHDQLAYKGLEADRAQLVARLMAL